VDTERDFALKKNGAVSGMETPRGQYLNRQAPGRRPEHALQA
jgi:hypothetical protein